MHFLYFCVLYFCILYIFVFVLRKVKNNSVDQQSRVERNPGETAINWREASAYIFLHFLYFCIFIFYIFVFVLQRVKNNIYVSKRRIILPTSRYEWGKPRGDYNQMKSHLGLPTICILCFCVHISLYLCFCFCVLVCICVLVLVY